MTSSGHELDDHELDAMLEAIARRDAPRSLETRVSQALDGHASSPLIRHRIGVAMAAVAAALLVAVALWTSARHPAAPAPALVSPQLPNATARAGGSPSTMPPLAPEKAGPARLPSRAARVTPYRAASQDDHDRALAALASLPAVGPRDIAPAALQTAPLEIDRIDDIAPLTIQGGRDTSGRGDFR